MTVFFRLLDAAVDVKASDLLRAIGELRQLPAEVSSSTTFTREVDAFTRIPTSPFAYWLSDAVQNAFSQAEPFRTDDRMACNGASTCDDFRYCRFWCETPSRDATRRRYVPYNQGSKFSPFAKEVPISVPWDDDRETFFGFIGRPGRWQSTPVGAENYFKAALTWPLRGIRLSVQALPKGCAFSVGGKVAIADEQELPWMLALLNSTAADYAVRIFAGKVGGVQYESGLIEKVPIPRMSEEDRNLLVGLARRAWSLRRSLDTIAEASRAFLLPLGLNEKITGITRHDIEQELDAIQTRIDDIAFRLYGIGPQDRASIEASSKWSPEADADDAGAPEDGEDEVTSDQDDDSAPTSDSLFSWLVGVAFGRFDPRLATGERPIPPEPGPFDPLPSRSPGMYPEGEDPADRPDILVDDEGHADDLAVRAQAVAERVKVDVPENLRSWLAREFFPLHIKMYSKSRRKAPIYWQLATPSASYSVWLYIHAFSKDTLFRVQNDYVGPKLAHEERRLESLTSELRDGATAAQRKTLAAQEAVVDELRAFLDEVKRVAPLWKPNLDDGVIINFAPLWRLVPQNKSWQKELKSTWDALCEGKYDWAHLAMHLWPERVVPKCAKDRSLAIAHGLEDVFWVEGTDGRWTARKTPTRSVDELVRERTSPAVKSALKSLLEAPTAAGKSGGRRGGGRRKSTAAAEGGDA
ncbi:hypothetical protein ACJ2CR_02560 [Myxococcus faecalis]|uniref:hypothetical protein n=1 Tax=Myxococcus faecalis TaxID=3115646 RepID=UPI0038D080F6